MARPKKYGYRKMWLALGRAGHEVGRDHVKRLMRAHGVQGAKRRGKPWPTTTRDPAATRSPDLVKRDFTAMGPDELWLADFTHLRCWLEFRDFGAGEGSVVIVGAGGVGGGLGG